MSRRLSRKHWPLDGRRALRPLALALPGSVGSPSWLVLVVPSRSGWRGPLGREEGGASFPCPEV